MTTSKVEISQGIPRLYINNQLMAPIAAYVGPRYLETFKQAGIQLYTFYVYGNWWLGQGKYDFSKVDAFLDEYTAKIPQGYFMPRIDLSQQGFPWWGEAHPAEMNLMLDIHSGEPRSQHISDPQTVRYLGHEVDLTTINLHSFHSTVWRAQAGQAISALIAHCEAAAYSERIWAWHLCDGLFCEWLHWNEYAFSGLADYSPASQEDFRRWLRRTYRDDPDMLSRAWGREIDFEHVSIPLPADRLRISHGEFYDPILDRPTIDYIQCFNDAMVDCIAAISRGAKRAMPIPKAVCIFYGYQFSNQPRPQLNAHYALNRLLACPDVDMLSSPHTYSYRGEGGYHSAQTVADSIRRAGKLHFDEIDCKTVWTPASVTWKTHISQPKTVEATIEMMKKDAAYQLASATAQWWMDLTDQGWFDAPELIEPIRRMKAIEERLQGIERNHFGEIAFVSSQPTFMFQAPREGLHNIALKMFRNWHLSRMGAPFELLQVEDLARADLPPYKLYIMANLFYLSDEQRAAIDRTVKRNGATSLWIYAPGFLDDRRASVENMASLTGIRFSVEDIPGELNVSLTDYDHPITRGLERPCSYGSGVNREMYLQPPKTQYLPETGNIIPAFYVDDSEARVLGLEQRTGKPGLVLKEMGEWRSIYSAAPLIPWQIMGKIVEYAGAQRFNDQGDMVWGNNAFLALYTQCDGMHTLHFPGPVDVEDAYDGLSLGKQITELKINLPKWHTKLLFIS